MICITLGGGKSLCIDEQNHLVIEERNTNTVLVDLGPATERRFKDLKSFIERLSIHAIKD